MSSHLRKLKHKNIPCQIFRFSLIKECVVKVLTFVLPTTLHTYFNCTCYVYIQPVNSQNGCYRFLTSIIILYYEFFSSVFNSLVKVIVSHPLNNLGIVPLHHRWLPGQGVRLTWSTSCQERLLYWHYLTIHICKTTRWLQDQCTSCHHYLSDIVLTSKVNFGQNLQWSHSQSQLIQLLCFLFIQRQLNFILMDIITNY